jgi:hypothetical protein
MPAPFVGGRPSSNRSVSRAPSRNRASDAGAPYARAFRRRAPLIQEVRFKGTLTQPRLGARCPSSKVLPTICARIPWPGTVLPTCRRRGLTSPQCSRNTARKAWGQLKMPFGRKAAMARSATATTRQRRPAVTSRRSAMAAARGLVGGLAVRLPVFDPRGARRNAWEAVCADRERRRQWNEESPTTFA